MEGDIMIAIDESGSISSEKFSKIIDAVIYFIKSVDIQNGKVRIGLIVFALDVFVNYDLDSFTAKNALIFVTNLLRYQYRGGPTFTHKALNYLRKFSFTPERGDRPKYPNYVVLFTDGKSQFPWKTKRQAELLKRRADIMVIGVGPQVYKQELRDIASYPPDQHVFTTSFLRINSIMGKVLEHVCEGTHN